VPSHGPHGPGHLAFAATADELDGQHIYLFTDDAEAFYRTLGYRPQGVGMSVVVGRWLGRG